MSQKPLRVALRNDCLGFSIEKYAVVADRKNARNLMCERRLLHQVIPQPSIRSSGAGADGITRRKARSTSDLGIKHGLAKLARHTPRSRMGMVFNP
jgi:hypothetical protein